MANYKHANTNQSQIVVLNFGELFPEDHHVRRLLEIIQQLDLSQFDSNYLNGTAKGGRKAFPVDRLLAILIYSLLHGNISMRNLERDLSQRADLLFLSGGLTLDHTTISVFRKRHTEASEKVDDPVDNSKEPPQSNYILDSGYSSNKNLEALKDKDIYMPDKEFASKTGGTTKPEDRHDKQEKEEQQEQEMSKSELEFTYELETDTFTCPAGEKLSFKAERPKRDTTYRIYRKFGCGSCSMKGQCVGSRGTRKEISVASHNYETLREEKIKRVRPYGSHRVGLNKTTNPLALKMREKLKSSEGRQVYSLCFPIAESSIGVIKAIRNGREFLRRGLDRVQIEWIERCIAHNIAKMMEFTRV